MMDNYAKEVEDFKFIPLQEDFGDGFKKKPQEQSEDRRLRVTVGINGWLNSEDDIKKPWRVLSDDSEVFALRYEMKTMLALGTALRDLVTSFAWQAVKREIITRTVLATLFAALWPIQVMKIAANVDNPFSRARHRSNKAGKILADALINRVQGERPVTLIGYSLGASAIHACLQSLAEREAFGLIDTCVIIGAPAPSNAPHWRTLRSVVSGKIFNVYSENDMMLGFVYRMHSLSLGVAGLQPISDVEGIENLDLSERVSGHLRYPELTGEILRQCNFIGIKAGKDIEKDDVIKMKDEHAEGKLFDFDEQQQAEVEKDTYKLRSNTVSPGVTKDFDGLSITPPALDHQVSSGDLDARNLPPKPDEIDDAYGQPERKAQEEEITRKPVLPPRRSASPEPLRPSKPQEEEPEKRPDSPESYKGITLVDNDSD